MSEAITEYWDYRLLYIYALFGGYVRWTEQELSKAAINFINENENLEHCMAFLGVLEKSELVFPKRTSIKAVVRNIKGQDTGEVSVSEKPQRQINSDAEIEVAKPQWFHDKVRAYLALFQTDMMFQPYTDKRISYHKQKSEILDSLMDTKEVQKVEGSQHSNNIEPFKILETLFSMVNEGLIEIHDIKPVLYNTPAAVKKWGFDATIFEAKVQLKVAKGSIAKQSQSMEASVTAEARIDGTQIYIGVQGETLVPLWRVRTDSGTYNFMHYVQSHTNQNIGIGDISTLEGCASYKDMTEVVRNLHFDKQLKKIFFDGTTKKTVRFSPLKELTAVEAQDYKSLLRKLAKES